MTTTLLYLFAFVVVLSLVVIVHEGGHFIVARLCGVKVTDFSMGFGKKLFSWTDKHGTCWKVCAIPLGGYVKMLGDEDAAGAKSSNKNVPKKDLNKTFMSKNLAQRAAIIFAGPAMNYVFAFVLLVGLAWGLGEVIIKPIVGSVLPDSAAAEAGLLPQDEIVSINGTKVESFVDIQRQTRLTSYGKTLNLKILRGGIEKDISLTPKVIDPENDIPMIGITAAGETAIIKNDLTFIQAVQTAGTTVWEATRDTLVYLSQIISGKRAPKDMRGPLGIAEASGDALQGGLISLIAFVAQISIAIGLMNLLPIPLLDGGHLFLYAIEAIRRKPLAEKTQTKVMWAGLCFLLAIFAYTLLLDVPRIIQRVFG
ncbi:MAG: RIP metalloprotease [Alphaproteobacteria bacterium]|nr:RIP metalloprotease [Alphaproteobacteria bacterium]